MSTPPPTMEDTIAFISGVTSSATVAATSYGSWFAAGAANPATYDPTKSYATKWGDLTLSPSGTPGGTVKYWFDTASNWTVVEKAALVSGLGLWSAVANISFSLAPTSSDSNFIFYRAPNEPGGDTNTAFTLFPNEVLSTIGHSVEGEPGTGAFIAIDTNDLVAGFGPISDDFAKFGGYPIMTYVHEIGHMLGLGHAGPYNGAENAHTQQFSPYDTRQWALMSYVDVWKQNAKWRADYPVPGTDFGVAPDGSDYVPTTPMILDILAAQRLYGPATSGPLASGGQVFGFNNNFADDEPIKRYFDFTVNQHPVITIWDGGLNNTLDLSGFSAPSTVNLNPGTFSSVDGATNNIAIAENTVIETAIGGSGNDTITGNAYNNVLVGGAGNDVLNAGPGSDFIIGGPGADHFTLGGLADGVDTFKDFARFQGDQVVLDHVGFGLGGTGSLAAVGVDLVYGLTPQTAAPTILDNQGDLYWDADGTGAGAATLFAHVNGIGTTATVATPATNGWSVAATGDFNGDGITDILWQNASTGATSEWLMGGGGLASNPATPGAQGWDLIASADFSGDGITDLLWKNVFSGVTSEWLMSANGGVASFPGTPGAQGWDLLDADDFNGDGITDLLWKHAISGVTSEWLMAPGGGVASYPATPGAQNWELASTGDFNGDGITDLMWQNSFSGITSEWLMSANGGVASFPGTPGAQGWDLIASADFSGDGITDLLWKNASSGVTSEWVMAAGGGVGRLVSTPGANGWDLIALGDFNGDHIDDLFWKNASSGATSEWLMAPGGGVAAYPTTPGAQDWDLAAFADFNGDGITDLLWKNATSGITSEWLMGPDGTVAAFTTTPDAQGLELAARGDFHGGTGNDLLWTRASNGATETWAFTNLAQQDFLIV
jgi:serralysin